MTMIDIFIKSTIQVQDEIEDSVESAVMEEPRVLDANEEGSKDPYQGEYEESVNKDDEFSIMSQWSSDDPSIPRERRPFEEDVEQAFLSYSSTDGDSFPVIFSSTV